ncbi:glyoxylase-like metal-dependent hydrolase (beta-lactamase superfamily II) [Stella humosa]|uniref:Glyoxylase-like metal-dependent hydrolase (Beta-lactamase superfamily II) n=1 Tax=Stella humosa TaxID=94 RepID=A0A3N1MED0_9PROT|nr:MBL fold metallo-hydrolase [Stella humosa]ROP99525.1 glyoxylase-like metal-dependent hydrolase (beta-lactamase superfamily II) [Stella humosa]BBK31261.1 MBL fold hydrolase [Stella humosa]
MLTRRTLLTTIAAGAAALPLASAGIARADTPLAWTAFPTSEAGFLRAPVLLTGATEAILIDAGFTYSDGAAVVEAIRQSGKRLATVYVSANDPDFYFSLVPIRKAFPAAQILAAPQTVELMRRKAAGKVKAWAGKLGANGPQSVDELVFPTASTADALFVDGQRLEIVETPGTNDRGRYLWVPSLQAVFGGVLVFGGMYPWVADTATAAERGAWLQALDGIAARKPRIVVPGHMVAGWPTDMTGVAFTRGYLVAFEQEAAKATDAAALIAAMRQRYPDAAMPVSLEIGAKVAKGEMRWG